MHISAYNTTGWFIFLNSYDDAYIAMDNTAMEPPNIPSELIQYIIDKLDPLEATVVSRTCTYLQMRCPRVLSKNDIAVSAAQNGYLEVLQWARQNGCPWDELTCANAAGNGHLEVLQWARQNGCPWNKRTCTYASKNGHLEVLQWARENGCPWDESTYENDVEIDLEAIHMLLAIGCPQ